MGAGRVSYKISTRWKYGGKTFWEKNRAVNILIVDTMVNDYARKLFIKDNFTQPFNNLIGCKLFGHDFHWDGEGEYVCYKCWKRISEKRYTDMVRRRKLLKLKKKI